MPHCLICYTTLHSGLHSWHQVCPHCGYEQSTLQSAINVMTAHDVVDEVQRVNGLRPLRMDNAIQLLNMLYRHTVTTGNRLLDVGCSHGWFLEAAVQSYNVLGIEPDTGVARQAMAQGLPVREGYFPNMLAPNEQFEVIVFNDVIEHIPEIRAALEASHRHLAPDGLLLLNVPNSQGIFYRIARFLHIVGVQSPFLRMWQWGYPSPHVHYFHAENLQMLLNQAGFDCVEATTIKAVSRTGLWARLRFAQSGLAFAIGVYAILLLALPVLHAFKQDSLVCLFRKKLPQSGKSM